MSVVTLRAQSHLAIPYAGGGLLTLGSLAYYVESEYPTYAFAVDSQGLSAFQSGQNYGYWGSLNAASIPNTVHKYQGPPMSAAWYLIIVNQGMQPTAVYYRAGS